MNATYQQGADLAIVGGGVLALAIAWEFLRRTTDVHIALICPEVDTLGASRASGAMLSGYGEATKYGLSSEPGRVKSALRIEAAQLWKPWMAQLCEAVRVPPATITSGTVVIVNSVSGPIDQQNFDAMVQLLEEQEEPFSPIDPILDLGLQPSTEDRPMRAMFLPNEAYVDAGQVLDKLRELLRSNVRVRWVDGNCSSVQPLKEGQRGYTLMCSGQEIRVERVVLASGAASLRCIVDCDDVTGKIPPLLAGAGVALECHGVAESFVLPYAIRTPNRAFSCGLHALPRDDHGIYLGATNNVQVHPARTAMLSDVAFLIDCGVGQIDRRLASFNLTGTRVGNRPLSIDAFPLLGETSLPGLWIATGTYRDGFLLAPLIAKRLFDAMLSGASTLKGAETFRPERPPLASGDREAAIQHGIENFVAIAYERRTRLPAVGSWEDDFRSAIERRVRNVYMQLGTAYVLPPDFLWDVGHHGLLEFLISCYKRIENNKGVS